MTEQGPHTQYEELYRQRDDCRRCGKGWEKAIWLLPSLEVIMNHHLKALRGNGSSGSDAYLPSDCAAMRVHACASTSCQTSGPMAVTGKGGLAVWRPGKGALVLSEIGFIISLLVSVPMAELGERINAPCYVGADGLASSVLLPMPLPWPPYPLLQCLHHKADKGKMVKTDATPDVRNLSNKGDMDFLELPG